MDWAVTILMHFAYGLTGWMGASPLSPDSLDSVIDTEAVTRGAAEIFNNMRAAFSEATAEQLLACLAAIALAWFLRIPTWKLVLHIQRRLPERYSGTTIIHMIKKLLWPALAFFLLCVADQLLSLLDYPSAIATVLAFATGTWVLIRIFMLLLHDTLLVRFLAGALWAVIALNAFGWLDPVFTLLDSHHLPFTQNFGEDGDGGSGISYLSVLQALILGALLFWIASNLARIATGRIDKDRNLPGSSKVLLSQITQGAVFIVAALIGLSALNIPLSAFSLFGGAIGLGIGFGLQQIFAAFVSGMILLVDKSVKPGDVIELGESQGTVNYVGLRYTSVATRNQEEHLIPNDKLLSNTVINWSHSNKFVRIRKQVGVSYNSDVRRVRQLTVEALNSVPRVLSVPSPQCLINDFGDSAVVLEIHFWIRDPQEGVVNVTSDALQAVWDIYQDNDVEIPFPQHDLHIISDKRAASKTEAAPKSKSKTPAKKS